MNATEQPDGFARFVPDDEVVLARMFGPQPETKYDFSYKSPNGYTPGSREWREEAIAAYQAAPQPAPDQAANGTPGPWETYPGSRWYGTTMGLPGGVVGHVHGDNRQGYTDVRLLVAAVNAVRAAMPDLTDQERITALEVGALKQAVEALERALKNLDDRAETRKKWNCSDQAAYEHARAALEAIGR